MTVLLIDNYIVLLEYLKKLNYSHKTKFVFRFHKCRTQPFNIIDWTWDFYLT